MIPPAGTEPYVVNKRDRLRAFVLAVACGCALVLNCVGTGYRQIVPKTVNNGYYVSLWWIYQCIAGVCGPRTDMINYGNTCSELSNPFRAAEAFVVAADIILGFAFIYALLEYFAVVSRVIGVILAIIFIILDIVAWAIVIAVYNRQICGTTLAWQHDLDAGLDLLVAATVLVFLAVVFWFIRFCCWSGDCCTNRYTAQPVQVAAPPMAPAMSIAPVTYTPVARVL
jgi:uncharacterized membrane protein YhaH (DUF805 family)